MTMLLAPSKAVLAADRERSTNGAGDRAAIAATDGSSAQDSADTD
jgi:hypothetical protein